MLTTHIYYRNPRWNITNWIRYFVAVNTITILSNTKYCKISFVWSAVPVIKIFQKDNISIFWTFSMCIGDGSRQFWWTLTYQRQLLDVILSGFAVRKVIRLDVIWLKRSSSGVIFYRFARSRAVNSQLCLHETIDYSVSNCFMNIKMKSIIIYVETNFRHANHSAAFVSGRLLRFHIPKFHHIPVTCWCLLPSDLVNTS